MRGLHLGIAAHTKSFLCASPHPCALPRHSCPHSTLKGKHRLPQWGNDLLDISGKNKGYNAYLKEENDRITISQNFVLDLLDKLALCPQYRKLHIHSHKLVLVGRQDEVITSVFFWSARIQTYKNIYNREHFVLNWSRGSELIWWGSREPTAAISVHMCDHWVTKCQCSLSPCLSFMLSANSVVRAEHP